MQDTVEYYLCMNCKFTYLRAYGASAPAYCTNCGDNKFKKMTGLEIAKYFKVPIINERN